MPPRTKLNPNRNRSAELRGRENRSPKIKEKLESELKGKIKGAKKDAWESKAGDTKGPGNEFYNKIRGGNEKKTAPEKSLAPRGKGDVRTFHEQVKAQAEPPPQQTKVLRAEIDALLAAGKIDVRELNGLIDTASKEGSAGRWTLQHYAMEKYGSYFTEAAAKKLSRYLGVEWRPSIRGETPRIDLAALEVHGDATTWELRTTSKGALGPYKSVVYVDAGKMGATHNPINPHPDASLPHSFGVTTQRSVTLRLFDTYFDTVSPGAQYAERGADLYHRSLAIEVRFPPAEPGQVGPKTYSLQNLYERGYVTIVNESGIPFPEVYGANHTWQKAPVTR